MTKVNTLSSDVQRSNSDIFSVQPLQSHGKIISFLFFKKELHTILSEFPFAFTGRDCSDIKETLEAVSPKIPSGIYIIQPENTDVPFEESTSFYIWLKMSSHGFCHQK